jgi:transcriptional regulator with XRE-family HTH domain
MTMNTFVKRLNDAITKADMTQAELSMRTGISEAAISNYRKGKYEPKHKQIYLLAVALNVSPSWLMGFDIDENEDRLDQALTSLWSSLTDEQKSQALAYMQFLIANQTSNI